MKLLFATSLLPENEATSGFEIANRALLFGLRALGHEVVPIGFANIGKSKNIVAGSINLGELSVSNADVSLAQKLKWLKRAVENRTTFAAAKLQVVSQNDLAALIDKIGNLDGVIINGAPIAAAFEKVLTRLPFIYVAHNVEWQTAAQSSKDAISIFERTLFAREARMLNALESRVAVRSKHVLTLAEEDCAAFRELGATSVSPVPLIVNLEVPKPGSRQPKWDVGLIGTWSWAPNRVGLDWFLNHVTPHLPNDFTIAIAGKISGSLSIKHPGVKLLGMVPSAQAFLQQCSCFPLVSQAGTGVQLKTLEAFELGLPTVSTLSSVRGISFLPENCSVQTEPKLFAEALIKKARMANPAEVDGRHFHSAQKVSLLSALASGLASLMPLSRLEAAE